VVVAFDMFGTLADTATVAGELAPACGGPGRPRRPEMAEHTGGRALGARRGCGLWYALSGAA
jgi:hypothetical protein